MRGLHRDPSWTTRHASARTGPVSPVVERATGLATEAATVRTATPRWLSELAERAARSETADVDHQIVEELASKPLTGDPDIDYWINSAQISKSDGTDYDIVQGLARLAGRRTAAAEQWREVENGLWRFEDDQFMASVTAPWPGEEAWSWTVETLSRQQIRGGQAYGKLRAMSAAEEVMSAHRTATVRTADSGEGPFVGSIRDRQKQLGFNAICRDCRWIGPHWGTVQEARFDADMHATIKHDDDDWQFRQETLSSGQLDRLSTEFRTSSHHTAATTRTAVEVMWKRGVGDEDEGRLRNSYGEPMDRYQLRIFTHGGEVAFSLYDSATGDVPAAGIAPTGEGARALAELEVEDMVSSGKITLGVYGEPLPAGWSDVGGGIHIRELGGGHTGVVTGQGGRFHWSILDADDRSVEKGVSGALGQSIAECEDAIGRHGLTAASTRTAATAQLTTGATHRVSGWDWDHRLSGFVARAGTAHFACPCGTTLATPGFTSCHCGKVWNAYEITSGTERKLIAREIPRRDVVLARRLP